MGDETKAIYKLLVGFKLIPEKPVSGEEFQVVLNCKNIGDSDFSDGQLGEVLIRFSRNTASINPTKFKKFPNVKVGESVELEPFSFFAIEHGAAWIQVRFKPIEGTELHLYQNPEFDMGQSWGIPFNILKREYVEIVKLLQRIVELLEEREKKCPKKMSPTTEIRP